MHTFQGQSLLNNDFLNLNSSDLTLKVCFQLIVTLFNQVVNKNRFTLKRTPSLSVIYGTDREDVRLQSIRLVCINQYFFRFESVFK